VIENARANFGLSNEGIKAPPVYKYQGLGGLGSGIGSGVGANPYVPNY
jgi:hypothetical protein